MSFFATYDGSSYQLTTAGFTALVIIMIAILLIGCAIFGGKKKFSAKQLAFSAMAIALAMVTSMIKLFDMPMGGSVTLLSMLFIVLIGYWYGLGAGLTAAFAYGILQLVVDPYIISVPQMLVDYLFAFGALGAFRTFQQIQTWTYQRLYRWCIRSILLRIPFRLDFLRHVCSGRIPECSGILPCLQRCIPWCRSTYYINHYLSATSPEGIECR